MLITCIGVKLRTGGRKSFSGSIGLSTVLKLNFNFILKLMIEELKLSRISY